jgi:hypothetical protein
MMAVLLPDLTSGRAALKASSEALTLVSAAGLPASSAAK